MTRLETPLRSPRPKAEGRPYARPGRLMAHGRLRRLATVNAYARINEFCLKRAEALVASLSNLEPRGFEAAFGSLLAYSPYKIPPHRAYCHTAPVFALILADQPCRAAPSTGDGRADVSLRTAAGNVHVVEIKHRQAPETKMGKSPHTLLDYKFNHWGVEVLHNRLDCSLNEDKRSVWKLAWPEVPSLIRKLVLAIIVPLTKRNGKVSVNEVIQLCRHDREYLRSLADDKPGKVVTPTVAIKRRVEAVIASSKSNRRV